jgi:hypothetical protein
MGEPGKRIGRHRKRWLRPTLLLWLVWLVLLAAAVLYGFYHWRPFGLTSALMPRPTLQAGLSLHGQVSAPLTVSVAARGDHAPLLGRVSWILSPVGCRSLCCDYPS